MKFSQKYAKSCKNLANAINQTANLLTPAGTLKNMSPEDDFQYDHEKLKLILKVSKDFEGNGTYYKFVKGLKFQRTSKTREIKESVVNGKIIKDVTEKITVVMVKPSIGFVFDLFTDEYTILPEKTPKQLKNLSAITLTEREEQAKIFPTNLEVFNSITSFLPKSIEINEKRKADLKAKAEEAAKAAKALEAAKAAEAKVEAKKAHKAAKKG